MQVRVFDEATKRAKYEQQHGVCSECKNQGRDKKYKLEEMDADHITAWSKGGASTIENCVMLCKFHNRSKGNS